MFRFADFFATLNWHLTLAFKGLYKMIFNSGWKSQSSNQRVQYPINVWSMPRAVGTGVYLLYSSLIATKNIMFYPDITSIALYVVHVVSFAVQSGTVPYAIWSLHVLGSSILSIEYCVALNKWCGCQLLWMFAIHAHSDKKLPSNAVWVWVWLSVDNLLVLVCTYYSSCVAVLL
jgi:hypothetical protein